MHREELLKHVKKPTIHYVEYESPDRPTTTQSIASMRDAYFQLDIREDPYILKLRANLTDRNQRELVKAIEKNDTYCIQQIKGLYVRCLELSQNLGVWAANYYLWRSITNFMQHSQERQEGLYDRWLNQQNQYLQRVLQQVHIEEPPKIPRPANVTEKVTRLIRALTSAPEKAVGIIFATDRVTVRMLYELLSACPEVVERYSLGAVVGTSSQQGKKRSIYEFLNTDDPFVLQKFRSGKINLLIATSVLEEGIDVPACNMVICFDQPATFKAFIQRRGRARMRDSQLIMFFERQRATNAWEVMEDEMKRVYEDQERELQKMEQLEETEDVSDMCFTIEQTGARLDFDNAKQHLEHFCRTLSSADFVDARPDYIITTHGESLAMTLSATVLLPSFLPEFVRKIDSKRQWKSEKNATKDAAFQAYIALYKARLVNEHLLPFKPDQLPGLEQRASIAEVKSVFNPWLDVAEHWKANAPKWMYPVAVFDELGAQIGEYQITLPLSIDRPRPIKVYVEADIIWEIRFDYGLPIDDSVAESMPDHTSLLLALHYGHRWPVEEAKHVIKITIPDSDYTKTNLGEKRYEDLEDLHDIKNQRFLIRDNNKTPYQYQGVIPQKPQGEDVQHPFREFETAPEDEPYLILKRWPKRSDFLHPILASGTADVPATTKLLPWVLPSSWATVDTIPVQHAQFAMLIPSLMHELEVWLITKNLAEHLLAPVDFTNKLLIREAISARSAAEPLNYERVEFLGDSILKYCASVLAIAMRTCFYGIVSLEIPNKSTDPEWPEGYLTYFKDRLISNSRLSRASVEKGLSAYILAKAFTGQKWRPLLVNEVLNKGQGSTADRTLSTKTLADVVEALVGAAYLDGGINLASKCIGLFVDEHEWPDVSTSQSNLFHLFSTAEVQPWALVDLEELIGYKFLKKSLLVEAMTHASYVADEKQRSLDRLEFLGDAVLDNIIVTRIYAVKPPLSHDQMHILKTATVNADFLAFMSMEHNLSRPELVIGEEGEIASQEVATPLWKFLRHASPVVGTEQASTAERYARLRGEIVEAMEHGTHYPWALLARLQAKKMFSDQVEALIGAVWIDSGSLMVCQDIVRRLGILKYLDRLIRDKVQVQHPKEVLGIYAGNEVVTYQVDVAQKSKGEREYKCKVLVGRRLVAAVEDGVSKEEVKTKAATEAVKVYDLERMDTSAG
jgi:dsRNA-specific ribonuclease